MELDLSRNSLGDTDQEESDLLFDGMQTSLKSLSLCGCGLGKGKGSRFLLGVLANLPNLIALELADNFLDGQFALGLATLHTDWLDEKQAARCDEQKQRQIAQHQQRIRRSALAKRRDAVQRAKDAKKRRGKKKGLRKSKSKMSSKEMSLGSNASVGTSGRTTPQQKSDPTTMHDTQTPNPHQGQPAPQAPVEQTTGAAAVAGIPEEAESQATSSRATQLNEGLALVEEGEEEEEDEEALMAEIRVFKEEGEIEDLPGHFGLAWLDISSNKINAEGAKALVGIPTVRHATCNFNVVVRVAMLFFGDLTLVPFPPPPHFPLSCCGSSSATTRPSLKLSRTRFSTSS